MCEKKLGAHLLGMARSLSVEQTSQFLTLRNTPVIICPPFECIYQEAFWLKHMVLQHKVFCIGQSKRTIVRQ